MNGTAKRRFRASDPAHIKLIVFAIILVALSCNRDLRTDSDISTQDKKFIRELGILDPGENIILFDSQGGGLDELMTSGNFFTNKRIASYWIDNQDTTKTSINSAFFTDIVTMRRFPMYRSLTCASYVEVSRRDGTKFNVYVDADSMQVINFFDRAFQAWNAKKNIGNDSK